jgi:hypothetical protein
MLDDQPGLLPSFQREAELQMACAYAGPVAEARFTKRRLFAVCVASSSYGDMQFIDRVKKLWWTEESERMSKDGASEALAKRIIRSRKGWEIVAKISERLLLRSSLSSDECSDIYVEVTGRIPLDHNHPDWRLESL